jgi:hypothetical protein
MRSLLRVGHPGAAKRPVSRSKLRIVSDADTSSGYLGVFFGYLQNALRGAREISSCPSIRHSREMSSNTVATDYDEVRPEVAESRIAPLEAVKSANSSDTRSVVLELDETDTVDRVELPGADLSGEELIIQVIPRAADEFTCYSCFLVRHRSQLAREKDGHAYCMECEGQTATKVPRPRHEAGLTRTQPVQF